MQNIYSVPMQKELDPMNLRSLASVEPPEDDWPVIRAALEQDRRRTFRRRGTLLATAAVVVMAAVPEPTGERVLALFGDLTEDLRLLQYDLRLVDDLLADFGNADFIF